MLGIRGKSKMKLIPAVALGGLFIAGKLYAEPGVVDCSTFKCPTVIEDRPAFIFGAGPEGIKEVQKALFKNRDIVSSVLEYELNTENEAGLASQYLLPIANNAYPITESFPLGAADDPVLIPGLGFVLDPEGFSQNATDAVATEVNFQQVDNFSGVQLNNFKLTNISMDFSAFENATLEPQVELCMNVGLDIETSLGIGLEYGDKKSEIAVENLKVGIDTSGSKPACFMVELDFANLKVKNITTKTGEPLLNRQVINKALASDSLRYQLPDTSPLKNLPPESLRSTIAGFVAPVLATPKIAQEIENPLINSVEKIISEQINDYLVALFDKHVNGDYALPPLNLPNNMFSSTIQENIEVAERLMNRGSTCKRVYERVNNLLYWANRHSTFKDALLAQSLENLVTKIKKYKRCKNYKRINSKLASLGAKAQDFTPNQSEAEALIMRQMATLIDGNLNVEIFIPELCQGDYVSALRSDQANPPCDQFHTMMDLSFINNFLMQQRNKGNLCQTFENNKCGFKIYKEGVSKVDAESKKPKFQCEDIPSINMVMMPTGKLRATVQLDKCGAQGSWFNAGGFYDTDFELVFDVELKTDCPGLKKACFDLDFNEEKLGIKGDLHDSWFSGSSKEAIIESFKETEASFEKTFNDFPIERMLQGLDVDKVFGAPVEGSPGFIGICLEINQENETKNRFCELARLRLPPDHPALSKCQP